MLKPNLTDPIGILHFVKHHLIDYQKKFQPSRSNGSWENGSRSLTYENLQFLGFFLKTKWPKKGKNQFWWVPWWVCTCPLNGTITFFKYPSELKLICSKWVQEKGRNFFLVEHWGPNPPGNPSELILALFGPLCF